VHFKALFRQKYEKACSRTLAQNRIIIADIAAPHLSGAAYKFVNALNAQP